MTPEKRWKKQTGTGVDVVEKAREDVEAAHNVESAGRGWSLGTAWFRRLNSTIRQRKNVNVESAIAWYKEIILRGVLRLRVNSPSKDGRHIDLDASQHFPLIDERSGKEYISNAIRSSRYTIWNFLPCQLWFQFSKIANFYFLIVGILQLIPGLSTTGTYTTILPLLFFLSFSIGREGYDDFRRYRLDKVENRRLTRVLYGYRPGGVEGNTRKTWTEKAQKLWVEMKFKAKNRGIKAIIGATLETQARNASSDSEKSTAKCEISDPSPWATIRWMDLKVGDIIDLERDDQVPADIILLHANGRDGIAYIETIALDGETNLKLKRPLSHLARHCGTLADISTCHAHFVIEDPNRDLYQFNGAVALDNEIFPLTLSNIVCRGSTLRNTPRATAMVINTGEECKIRMNASHKPHSKKPAIQAMTNRVVILLTVLLILLSIGCSAGYEIWAKVFEKRAWYLAGARLPLEDISIALIIEFNNLIPLALYVSLEIIKFAQFLLLQDIEMYDKASNTPTICNTQTIFENLGQVNYIFTDKTGTLTENVMRFRKMSVAGIAWRHDIPDRTKTRIRSEYEPQIPTQKEIESRQYAKTSPTSCKELPAVTVSKMPDDAVQVHQKSEFTTAHTQDEPLTSELLDFLRTNPHTVLSQKIKTFLLSLALCHTCFPEVQENGEIGFQAESPDELALVEAAQDLGYLLIDRSARSIHLLTHPSNSQVAIQETYEILQVVEFSSTRKRMSIIVRLPDGRICIFCKGADSVIQHRLKLASLAQEKAARVEHIHDERVHEEANEAMLRKSQALDTRSSFNRSRMSLDRPSVEINRKAFGRRAMRSAAVDPNHGVLGPGLWNRKHGLFGHAQGTLQAIISNDPSPLLTSEQKLVSKGDSSREVAKDLDEGTIFERCFQHIDDFATEGLRTLLYGYRFIDEVEYTTWREAYHRATTSLVNRQQMIESVGEVIERDFELAGATAIEDKLQKGVPETVEKLRRANIKIWMLTGDKRETAINIAHSTRICKSYSRLIILDHQNDSEGLQQQITSALLELEVGTVAHSVVVIDGRTLEAIEIQGLTAPLYELLLRVESVICCRATPSQKPPW